MSKAIFITGAASGIGRAAALLFARRGWFVGLYDVNREGLESLQREMAGEGPGENNGTADGRGTHGVLDVTDLEAFRSAVDAFGAASGGKMNALFQSAGVLEMGLFSDVPPQRAMRMIDINVKGVVNGVYAALPMLEKTPGSTIVTMCSASAVYGTPELAVYSATKFFVRGLTEALDIELRKRRVRVVDVMPLYVDTPMVNDASRKARSMSTLGVKLKPEDVAERVLAAVQAPVRGGPHVIPQANVRLLRTLSGLIPSSGRTIQRFFAKL